VVAPGKLPVQGFDRRLWGLASRLALGRGAGRGVFLALPGHLPRAAELLLDRDVIGRRGPHRLQCGAVRNRAKLRRGTGLGLQFGDHAADNLQPVEQRLDQPVIAFLEFTQLVAQVEQVGFERGQLGLLAGDVRLEARYLGLRIGRGGRVRHYSGLFLTRRTRYMTRKSA